MSDLEAAHSYGFAPGGYYGTCLDCLGSFIGDKRAIRCKRCALARATDAETAAYAAKGVCEGCGETDFTPNVEAFERTDEIRCDDCADAGMENAWMATRIQIAAIIDPACGREAFKKANAIAALLASL